MHTKKYTHQNWNAVIQLRQCKTVQFTEI